jgi:hypothetical protein
LIMLINTWQRVQATKLLVMQFSPPSSPHPLSVNILLRHI